MAAKDVDKNYTQAEVEATVQSFCPPGFEARTAFTRTDLWTIHEVESGHSIAEVYCTTYKCAPNNRWWVFSGKFVTEYPRRSTPSFESAAAIKKRSLSALMKEGRKFIRAESIIERLGALETAHLNSIRKDMPKYFTRDSDFTAAAHAALGGFVSPEPDVNAWLQKVARYHEGSMRVELMEAIVEIAYDVLRRRAQAGMDLAAYTPVEDEHVPRFFHKSYVSASFACEHGDMREELTLLYEALTKGYTHTNFNGQPTDITDVLTRFAKALDAGSDAGNIDAPLNKED